jgi:hypothetical protein
MHGVKKTRELLSEMWEEDSFYIRGPPKAAGTHYKMMEKTKETSEKKPRKNGERILR